MLKIRKINKNKNKFDSFLKKIEKLMDNETAHIQMMQHLSMHKQLISGDTKNHVDAILNCLKTN